MGGASRTPEEYRAWWDANTPVPYGLCWCGCGGETIIAPEAAAEKGWLAGEPRRYIYGLHSRVVLPEGEIVGRYVGGRTRDHPCGGLRR